jgi:enoyl-CoA hydratase/carnithine racemase
MNSKCVSHLPDAVGAVKWVQDGAIAWVTLDNASKYNAMSRGMWLELKQVFEAIGQDPGVRCVVVRGALGHFCAGGDIAQYPSFRFDAAQLQHFHEVEVWGGLQAMLDCDVPIVAQIEGNCMGAGVEIASCCDLRLASQSSRFGAPIARLGFPMAPREAALVAGAVGDTTARAMLLAAEVFDAQHMLARDFLLQVLPDDQLEPHIAGLVQRIAALAPQAAKLNKRTFRSLIRPVAPVEYAQAAPEFVAKVPVAVDLDAYAYADSAEHREGITAFLDKRKPNF